ncbi:antirestriction protein [Brucella pseudogrignonensis]|uniref:antirestriction protein n=1 Tax=Brucella pseudogrignonensis TaxID=419475 RepID=UPI003ECE730A
MPVYELARPDASIVSDARRPQFLPNLFGHSFLLIAENTVYNLMQRLSPLDYNGGFWDFYEHEDQPLYMAPKTANRFRITGDVTGFHGEVSADAAGIIATLFAFSHLSFLYQSDQLCDGYSRLYAYAAYHPEAAEIFQAID